MWQTCSAALDVADVQRVPQGAIVHIRRSKTDQEGKGHQVPVPKGTHMRPNRALDDWLADGRHHGRPGLRAIGKGDLLTERRLRPAPVAEITKRRFEAGGLDPDDCCA
jgi:hypothetical protein